MRRIFCSACVLWIAVSCTAAHDNKPVDWARVRTAFSAYDELPSPQNVLRVIEVLPKHGHVRYTGTKEEEESLDLINSHLAMLQRQVLSRDPTAVDLAFRLKNVADGAFAEDLDVMLGQLIRIDPSLFLRSLKSAPHQLRTLSGLVGNFGDPYVDKPEAQAFEAEKRIRALQTVADPHLAGVREKCVEALKQVASEVNSHARTQ